MLAHDRPRPPSAAPTMSGSLAVFTRQARTVDGQLPCLHEDPHLWFSERPADLELAKERCRPCPLRASCLAGALERGEPHGVWGGEIFAQGAVIMHKRSPGRPAVRRERMKTT